MTYTAAFISSLNAAADAAPAVTPAFGWDDVNPIKVLANLVALGATSVWQDIMTNIWSAGLWLAGFVFQLVDAFTAPDLSGAGLMSKIYPVTFGIGAGLALILALVQVGFAAWQRDGKGLGRLVVGVFQFMLVWGGMLGIGAALNVATAGLTQGMLQVSFGAPSFAKANVLHAWDVRQGVDAVTATVLGICGVFLVFAAIGYLLVMLVRAAALMILMATSPISAAGLLSEGTSAWFWKALRWFLAALMIGPLAALVLAIGKLLTDGVLSGAGDSTQSAVGTAVVGTVLIIIGAFCPLILFRLLAFVDPGTSSGASFRASLDAAGGVGGLLQGRGGTGAVGRDSGAATSQAGNGTSQGEAAADTATQGRITSALTSLGGSTGAAIGLGANKIASMGSAAATYGSDILGAAGVGHQQPYFGGTVSDNQQNDQNRQQGRRENTSDGNDSASDDAGPDVTPAAPTPAAPTPPTTTAPTPGSQPGAGAGGAGGKPGGAGGGPGGGAAGGAAGGVESAAAVAAL